MFLQGSLWSLGEIGIDDDVPTARIALDDTSWVDHAPGWLRGSDELFATLVDLLPWRQRRDVPMYDRLVDEPRLTAWWQADGVAPEPLPVLAELRRRLSDTYEVAFDSIGCNLYRDGNDSVAWHGDRHRERVVDPVVAIVSVGAPRPFRLRPRAGGPSAGAPIRTWALGRGDLLVMGGSCQHDWEHAVPKVRAAGARVSITFRHEARGPRRAVSRSRPEFASPVASEPPAPTR